MAKNNLSTHSITNLILQKQDVSLGTEKGLFVASLMMYATRMERINRIIVELQRDMKDGDVTMDFVLKIVEYVILKKIV